MLLSNRRTFLLGLVALGGCGFAPVHATKGDVQLRNSVLIQAPQTREEFELVKTFERRLGAPTMQAYTLSYNLTVAEETVVTSSSQELNRFNVLGTLSYTLKDTDGAVISQGTSKAFTSYSSTGSTVATDRSQRDARDRLMVILTDQTLTRLSIDTAR